MESYKDGKKQSWYVLSQEEIAPAIYSLWLKPEDGAEFPFINPGQFTMVYMKDSGRLLGRPISICEAGSGQRALRLVYRVTGKGTGTELLSHVRPGESLELLGPLGNGFPLQQAEGKRTLLVGGGIGIPPMLETAKRLASRGEAFACVLGYRDILFLTEEFHKTGAVYYSTEDGSAGSRGTVLDAVRENHLEAEVVFACGPKPMLRALKEFAAARGIVCWISMEERMACGVGACLGCVCESVETDSHTKVHNKRVCKDGPVFLSTEVVV